MQESVNRPTQSRAIPFDVALLVWLLVLVGFVVLFVTSKHNVLYLLDAERTIFFDYMDAIGVSRYLPVFVYPKGLPEKAGYFGTPLEAHQRAITPLWVGEVQTKSMSSIDPILRAAELIKQSGTPMKRIGVEMAFLPMDAGQALSLALPGSEIKDALFLLERLRAGKSAAELAKLNKATEMVTDSMLEVIAKHGPGTTKRELFEALKIAEVQRGLTFEYCLLASGTSHNRAPSEQRWEQGDVLSLDSGGNYHGYIGDLARMAVLGEPDQEQKDLLAEIEAVQQAAFGAVKAGAPGAAIYAAAEQTLAKTSQRDNTEFLAHGMGLVSHEAPRLTTTGPIPYAGHDAGLPLEAGMVVSIETTMKHLKRGFIKLEDTVAETADGYKIYGENGRGWNIGGTSKR